MTKANVVVPKLIKWDEVELPTAWQLERATPTLPRRAPEFQEIRQSDAGKVEIIFYKRNSFSSRIEATRSEYTSARRSFSVASQSTTNTIPRIIIPNTNLRGIETNSTIPRVVYQTNEEDDQKSIQSPTYSSLNLEKNSTKPATILDLQAEIHNLKREIKSIKEQQVLHQNILSQLHDDSDHEKPPSEQNLEHNEVHWSYFLGLINRLTIQKFFINIKVVEDFVLETTALFDTGADSNCILEGLIPSKYFEKTSEKLSTANGSKLQIRYKLSKATIENQGQQIPSKSPWSCATFYVNKQAEIERETPRLVINYKPLNQVVAEATKTYEKYLEQCNITKCIILASMSSKHQRQHQDMEPPTIIEYRKKMYGGLT
uniref:Retropepsins domain-containing protein n=1 Tax=Cajanus cajan TaxID=3821 RepID=A0A151QMT6_CAJCA|nr:hypothetical protein KK1_048028 [Cajanus cajan]